MYVEVFLCLKLSRSEGTDREAIIEHRLFREKVDECFGVQ